LAAVTLTAFKCGSGNEPVKNNATIPTTNFDYQNFGCGMYYVNMQADTVYVINSEEEFARYFNCETDPQIDFATKTLLFAFGRTTNGVSNIATEMSKENNIYTLNVDIELNDATVAQGWHIAVVVDKIDTQSVLLNVNIIRL
jgi:hypothetical protein